MAKRDFSGAGSLFSDRLLVYDQFIVGTGRRGNLIQKIQTKILTFVDLTAFPGCIS